MKPHRIARNAVLCLCLAATFQTAAQQSEPPKWFDKAKDYVKGNVIDRIEDEVDEALKRPGGDGVVFDPSDWPKAGAMETLYGRTEPRNPLKRVHWNDIEYTPLVLNGHKHVRTGSTFINDYGNSAWGGKQTCDVSYVGAYLLQLPLNNFGAESCPKDEAWLKTMTYEHEEGDSDKEKVKYPPFATTDGQEITRFHMNRLAGPAGPVRTGRYYFRLSNLINLQRKGGGLLMTLRPYDLVSYNDIEPKGRSIRFKFVGPHIRQRIFDDTHAHIVKDGGEMHTSFQEYLPLTEAQQKIYDTNGLEGFGRRTADDTVFYSLTHRGKVVNRNATEIYEIEVSIDRIEIGFALVNNSGKINSSEVAAWTPNMKCPAGMCAP